MSNGEDLEIMLSFIRHMIGCMGLRLHNVAVFLGNILGKWPVRDREKWGNMF
jgi:hypothetical protein